MMTVGVKKFNINVKKVSFKYDYMIVL